MSLNDRRQGQQVGLIQMRCFPYFELSTIGSGYRVVANARYALELLDGYPTGHHLLFTAHFGV